MATAMEVTEQSELRSELPDLRVGSNVRVNYRIMEGNKERIQALEGVIASIQLAIVDGIPS